MASTFSFVQLSVSTKDQFINKGNHGMMDVSTHALVQMPTEDSTVVLPSKGIFHSQPLVNPLPDDKF